MSRREKGTTLTEYGLIAALIAIIGLAGVASVGRETSDTMNINGTIMCASRQAETLGNTDDKYIHETSGGCKVYICFGEASGAETGWVWVKDGGVKGYYFSEASNSMEGVDGCGS